MNELEAIVGAFAEARARGEGAALATVVDIVGSAYRRPGARMLISASGHTVGTISGGCLERDVAERAIRLTESDPARVVEYDTRGAEDIVWGLGLGCNGVVRILLESLHEGGDGARALDFIAERLRARQCGVIATVLPSEEAANGASRDQRAGERVLLDQNLGVRYRSVGNDALVERIREAARETLAGRRAAVRSYGTGSARTDVFFDIVVPPRALVIFGAEHDAVPVARLARALGWHVTVVDTRAREATRERFGASAEVVLCRAEDVAACVPIAPDTAAVVMTHDYLTDVTLLQALVPSPASYLGILGPRQRTERLLEELRGNGLRFDASHLARLHGPIGMDIGAETPEEIALAIIAEIKATSAARGGGFLRDRPAPIHDDRSSDPPGWARAWRAGRHWVVSSVDR